MSLYGGVDDEHDFHQFGHQVGVADTLGVTDKHQQQVDDVCDTVVSQDRRLVSTKVKHISYLLHYTWHSPEFVGCTQKFHFY